MKSHHLSDEFCLDYVTGELPVEERSSVRVHLRVCSDCQSRVEQYRDILRHGLPSIAAEYETEGKTIATLPWSLDQGERRLYEAIDDEPSPDLKREPFDLRAGSIRIAPIENLVRDARSRSTLQTAWLVAASLILATTFGFSVYRLGLKRGLNESQSQARGQIDPENLKTQIAELVQQRQTIEATLSHRETLISELKSELKEQKKQAETLEEDLRSANLLAEEQAQQTSSQRDALARKLDDQQMVLASARKRVDVLEQDDKNDAIRVLGLENRIQQLAQEAKDNKATINEQQRLLAANRDIVDLMGARDLYIAEVYDVGSNGKQKKPYGRVFLTKGKSLVFYAYDLDQQPGLKNASTFQAWGLNGPDRNAAFNLGVMYVDNSTNRRWVLQFDDPKVLARINAVFVTVEPNGGSRIPSGRQVLFAYLGEEPNHP